MATAGRAAPLLATALQRTLLGGSSSAGAAASTSGGAAAGAAAQARAAAASAAAAGRVLHALIARAHSHTCSLAVGASYSMERAFSAADVGAFTQLTGDTNPIHVLQPGGVEPTCTSGTRAGGTSSSTTSSSSATSGDTGEQVDPSRGEERSVGAQAAAGAGAAIVPGMLLASLFPAIIGSHFSGALYLTQSLAFRSPCRVGEHVRAQVTVSRASGSRIQFETVCTSVHDRRTLVDGRALALIAPASK
ncbi:hypothetical protein Rsub_09050 [Raphidocelis subcapitata]|uniref:MaoC-like domain-containing protein n=1 Tax=Raphidocelis subcapitata TaxID=307507 RepID=A0A2V0PGD7_9CHLO|nr:hypothetical protein Rsub_09050 [Raphidocelis subcapitata]|eukprot:GBF96970.1 hypothetical protein Rsub_09050 [Raphidocelis subcapitata]